jgi:LytS/YehU family sensor histidine kinase
MGWAALLEQMSVGAPALEWGGESGLLLFVAGTLLFLAATIVHYLMATFAAARAAERSALELQVLARDAELKALRAQIDPHFLFNALNSVSALTTTDPAAARGMTLKLAEFLRLSLEYGSQKTITLDQELSLALRFLEIEKIRFGGRLKIRTSIEEAARNCRLPPLLLQPLIENAVRHGIAQLIDGGTVDIGAHVEGEHVRIVVANPVDPDARAAHRGGLGLENVRQRIAKMYGQDGRLDARNRDNHFDAAMSLPAR